MVAAQACRNPIERGAGHNDVSRGGAGFEPEHRRVRTLTVCECDLREAAGRNYTIQAYSG